jgi:hypothetical protein
VDESRFVDPGLTRWAFVDAVLVVCPRCDGPAVVALVSDAREAAPSGDRRATCAECGFSLDWPGDGGDRTIRWWTDGRDPHLGLDLLLRTPCAGHTLWAYNEAHLDLIERYVAARHRERTRETGGAASLVERLPPWIKAAPNRDEVLKGCERLRALLPPA